MNYINKAARQDAELKAEIEGGDGATITPQPAPSDVEETVEAADFNGLIALLVASGVLTSE